MARCSRRVAARSALCVLLCLCALRGGVRMDGPQLELYVDLGVGRASGGSAGRALPLLRAPEGHSEAQRDTDRHSTAAAAAAPTATRAVPEKSALETSATARAPHAAVPLLVGAQKLSMVLPIGPAVGTSVHGDHSRLSVLIRSLAKFFALDDLDVLLIVTPDKDSVAALLAQIAQQAASPSVDALLKKTAVASDQELAPETYQRKARGLNHLSGCLFHTIIIHVRNICMLSLYVNIYVYFAHISCGAGTLSSRS